MKKIFPDLKIAGTKFFDAHQDWEIPIPAFFIISPRRKMRSFDDFSNEEAKDFILLLRNLRAAMRDILDIRDVYVFQNEDTKHKFHVWVFPRYEWMEEFGRGINSVRPIMEHAKEELVSEEKNQEVREAAEKVKEYLEKSSEV